ncbi:hypothetical protein [Antrihabitans sp. YC2-6]|uniref:hypothetical protein n=1 Tax=Antrihabitans sp. YC2-6 TaxID=2799498 RepID=UPI0018F73F0C|nr:hypothetical protein [Antrihabitans sp. YC2-6]MBJ8348729.1 hypothetical protein [Antrihabitans sp. YC2-6]
MGSTRSKTTCWSVFFAGIVVAVLGIADLRAELAVLGLIFASTSGLVLLKVRAEALGRLDPMDAPRRVMAGTLSVPR